MLAYLCVFIIYLQLCLVSAEQRSFTHTRTRSIKSTQIEKSNSSENIVEESTISSTNTENTDLMDKLSWKCANNATCLYGVVNSVYQSYKRGETVKLGPFDLVKLPPSTTKNKNTKLKDKFDVGEESGRSMSTFVDFISGNAIRVPVGPMVFSVQRAEDDDNYIEIALLKKASTTGRQQGAAKNGGNGVGGMLGGGSGSGGGLLGGGGGMLGGGSGIGDGNGGGIGGGRRRQKNHQDKKQFQMYIPLYLAATTFGWTMVAAKAVGLLTIKALVISKLAFIVAAMVIVKKLMDNASEKMLYQYPEHSPYMMPYNMEYPMHTMGGELATSDMYHPSALQLAAAAPMQHQGHPGLESLGAESHLHHNIADMQNNTQVLAALNAVGLGQKVKREDAWIAKINFARHTEPLVVAGALAAAEEIIESEENKEHY